jgi:hypothetical protein
MEVYKIVLIFLLLVLSGFIQGQMEKIAFNFYQSLYKKNKAFFNPKVSFRNKYKQLDNFVDFYDEHGQKHWVKDIDKTKERFPGSTTVFVWLTDGWHLFKVVSGTCLSIAITILLMEVFALSLFYGLITFAGVKLINSISYVTSFKLK